MKRQVIGMKERINRLAKGIIDSEQPKMTWSPEKIDETLRMNTLMQRNLWIGSENGLSVKGFVYSSNLRVRIPGDNNSFGGLRCRIVYEVDTSFLTAGDTITGSFYLVTNCGEEEIPYEFHVEVADAGKTLGDLKTAEDFLRVAENDMETALRLLEYPDFVEVPFMQDLHVRALYDGLKGHGSRANFMEEFLVGLGVKKPVGLTIPGRARVYAELAENAEDTIEIRMDNWGSVYLEVTADGEFLHLPKKSATQADFEGSAPSSGTDSGGTAACRKEFRCRLDSHCQRNSADPDRGIGCRCGRMRPGTYVIPERAWKLSDCPSGV